jgi:hypothetical protein
VRPIISIYFYPTSTIQNKILVRMALNPLYSEVPDNPDLVLFVEKVLDRVHSKAVPILRDELRKKDIVLTEKLSEGLSRTISRNYQASLLSWTIEMDIHGQFQDYKTQRYSGPPPFQAFYEGILAAIDKGKLVPYSVPAYAQVSREATAKYIANATVTKVAKSATITRPSSKSGWFKKYFEDIIGPMNDQLLNAASAVAMKQSEYIITKTLQDRNGK